MAREITRGHELGDNALLEGRMPQMPQAMGARESGGQRLWHDQIPEPQTRVEDFAETAGVEDPLTAIEAF